VRCLTQTLRRTVKENLWSVRDRSGDLQERCLALAKGHQIARLIVRDAVDPAAEEDANPLEGEGAEGGLVLHAASLAACVEGVGPEGARDGLPNPLDEGLSEEGGALIAPVDGGLVAAAFGDGGDAGVLLERGGIWEALTALAEGDEEAWGKGGASARQGAEESVVGQLSFSRVAKKDSDTALSQQSPLRLMLGRAPSCLSSVRFGATQLNASRSADRGSSRAACHSSRRRLAVASTPTPSTRTVPKCWLATHRRKRCTLLVRAHARRRLARSPSRSGLRRRPNANDAGFSCSDGCPLASGEMPRQRAWRDGWTTQMFAASMNE
jgi:hypothetical protein